MMSDYVTPHLWNMYLDMRIDFLIVFFDFLPVFIFFCDYLYYYLVLNLDSWTQSQPESELETRS